MKEKEKEIRINEERNGWIVTLDDPATHVRPIKYVYNSMEDLQKDLPKFFMNRFKTETFTNKPTFSHELP